MNNKVEQKVLYLNNSEYPPTASDSNYTNFFFRPESKNSLKSYIENGWILKTAIIRDDTDSWRRSACVVLERTYQLYE